MQTLADEDLLILELEGLAEEYKIDIKNKSVELSRNFDFIRKRIAHLKKVDGIDILYCFCCLLSPYSNSELIRILKQTTKNSKVGTKTTKITYNYNTGISEGHKK